MADEQIRLVWKDAVPPADPGTDGETRRTDGDEEAPADHCPVSDDSLSAGNAGSGRAGRDGGRGGWRPTA